MQLGLEPLKGQYCTGHMADGTAPPSAPPLTSHLCTTYHITPLCTTPHITPLCTTPHITPSSAPPPHTPTQQHKCCLQSNNRKLLGAPGQVDNPHHSTTPGVPQSLGVTKESQVSCKVRNSDDVTARYANSASVLNIAAGAHPVTSSMTSMCGYYRLDGIM